MGTIDELLQNLKSLNLREQVPKLVEQTSYEITALNQAQLYFGVDSTVSPLTRYRSRSYAEKKNLQNPKPGFGNPDLFLTGAFYKGISVVVKGYDYEITSTDSKSDDLEKKYGSQIFGLAPKNKEKYASGLLLESIQSYITGKTGLEFR